MMSQVLHNILKNDYECLISHGNKRPILMVVLQKSGSFISIEISNNGPEIPAEIKEQIFVPFFTTKEEGSGVGLSLSKQIMLKLNGDIYLKKNEENMTTFVISQNIQSIKNS